MASVYIPALPTGSSDPRDSEVCGERVGGQSRDQTFIQNKAAQAN